MITTPDYTKQLQTLHKIDTKWGDRTKIPKKIIELIRDCNVKSILNFGCGKGYLNNSIKSQFPMIDIYGWDPAYHSYEQLPNAIDLIISTDVLEHIEPNLLNDTLCDLKNRSTLMYHLIACYEAVSVLPDGRNAHLIIESPKWWRNKMIELSGSIIYDRVIEENRLLKIGNKFVTEYECVVEFIN